MYCSTLAMVGSIESAKRSLQLDYFLTMTFPLECLDKASLKHQIPHVKGHAQISKGRDN